MWISKNYYPYVCIHIATLLYGSQHCIVKYFMDMKISVYDLNILRFFISSVCCFFSYFFIKKEYVLLGQSRQTNKSICKILLLGAFTVISFALQTYGLKYTTASKSSFILYFNVKFVIILQSIIRFELPTCKTWVSLMLTTLGLVILCTDYQTQNYFVLESYNIGDMLTLFSAFFSACFILLLGNISKETEDIGFINSVYMTSTFVTFTFLKPLYDENIYCKSCFDITFLTFVAYIGITSFIGQHLQTYSQQRIEPNTASIILSADPIYATIFSYIFLKEIITFRMALGMTCMVISILITN